MKVTKSPTSELPSLWDRIIAPRIDYTRSLLTEGNPRGYADPYTPEEMYTPAEDNRFWVDEEPTRAEQRKSRLKAFTDLAIELANLGVTEKEMYDEVGNIFHDFMPTDEPGAVDSEDMPVDSEDMIYVSDSDDDEKEAWDDDEGEGHVWLER